MRSEKEIRDMIKRIDEVPVGDNDEGYDRIRNNEDFEYICDIKDALQWALKEISATSTEQGRMRIKEEMKEIADKTTRVDEVDEDEYKKFREFIIEEFGRGYKDRDSYDMCNIGDAFDWVLGEISTENFISESYMNLENLRKKLLKSV